MIGRLAEGQHGVVAWRQLLDAGLSEKAIRLRIRSGHLLRIHRGVYAVGHARLRREGTWLAAVLAYPGAVLSHRDAAALYGLRPGNHRLVDVSAPNARAGQPAIRFHRTTALHAEDVTIVHGIPVTTVARTLVDLANVLPQDHLGRAVKEAERSGVFDLRAVEAAMARTRGRTGRGHRTLRKALQERRALEGTATDSVLEDAFLQLMRDSALPLPATNVNIEGFRIDAVWRTHRIAVELDGWQNHHTRHAFERDRERDAILTAAGWRVVRFTYRQVTSRPDGVIETLRRLGL